MKTMPRLSWLRDRKGSAIVYVAVTLVILVGFAGLAIDVGYLYLVRGELQNAADSGALAGAQVLFKNKGATVNAGAIDEARIYVGNNPSELVPASDEKIRGVHCAGRGTGPGSLYRAVLIDG